MPTNCSMLGGMGRRDQQIAIASTIGAVGLGGLMWIAQQPGFSASPDIIFALGCVFSGLTALSMFLWGRIAWFWLTGPDTVGTLFIELHPAQAWKRSDDGGRLVHISESAVKYGSSGGVHMMPNPLRPTKPYEDPGLRFKVTNLSATTLTEVVITIQIRISEVIREPNKKRSGRVTAEGPCKITIHKIDPGAAAAVELYCISEGNRFAMIWLPNAASARPIDDNKIRKLEVRHASPNGQLVPPRIPEQDPDAQEDLRIP